MSEFRFRPVHLILMGLIAFALFGALATGMMRHLLFVEWDRDTSQALHEHAVEHPALASTFLGLTELSARRSIWLEGACGLVAFAALRRWRWCATWLLTLVGALAGSQVKIWIGRRRPVFDDPFVREITNSFPSGHAVGSVLIFGTLLYFLSQRWRRGRPLLAALLGLLILLIGFSRVYLGAHWLSDVLGGYLFGLGWLLVSAGAVNALDSRARPVA